MSDIASGISESADLASEAPRSEARRFREVLDEGQTAGQSADIVRSIVREAPLLALASAFVVGVLVGRR
jgi:hypothetical protein